MKRLLVLMALAAASLSAPAAEIIEWATAISKKQGTDRTIVYRYAKEFRQGFDRAVFPDRIIIVWKYESESGMPAQPERESMDRMEDLLAPLIEQSGHSVLALVSTGEGWREWIFYAKSEGEFFASLNGLLAKEPRFPIEIHASKDPAWSTYERFHGEVRE